MKYTSAVAASILALCAGASAWTEEEEYGLYAREAEFDVDYSVDHLHPRDAYEYGLYVGELYARSAQAPAAGGKATPKASNKKDDLKSYVASSEKANALSAKEKAQKATIAKDMAELRSTMKAEKANNKEMDTIGKKLGARSFDDYAWDW